MKRKKLLRYLIIAAIILIVIAIIGKRSGKFGKPETIDVVVEKPTYRTIIKSISANGKIQPEVEVKISPEVSGEIIELPVKEGDKVTRGQLLCRIKPDTYISIRERAEAATGPAGRRPGCRTPWQDGHPAVRGWARVWSAAACPVRASPAALPRARTSARGY